MFCQNFNAYEKLLTDSHRLLLFQAPMYEPPLLTLHLLQVFVRLVESGANNPLAVFPLSVLHAAPQSLIRCLEQTKRLSMTMA